MESSDDDAYDEVNHGQDHDSMNDLTMDQRSKRRYKSRKYNADSHKRQRIVNNTSIMTPIALDANIQKIKDGPISQEYELYLQSLGFDTDCLHIPYRPPLQPYNQQDNDNNELSDNNGTRNFITIDSKAFQDDLKCPICLDEIDGTWTVMACLHRFCGECLHRYLRMNKTFHECPNCRTKIASRRSSNPDATFDEIVNLIANKADRDDRQDRQSNQDIVKSNLIATAGMTAAELSVFRRLHKENVKKFRLRQIEIKEKLQNKSRMNITRLESSSSSHADSPSTAIICLSLLPWPVRLGETSQATKPIPVPFPIQIEGMPSTDMAEEKPNHREALQEMIQSVEGMPSTDTTEKSDHPTEQDIPVQTVPSTDAAAEESLHVESGEMTTNADENKVGLGLGQIDASNQAKDTNYWTSDNTTQAMPSNAIHADSNILEYDNLSLKKLKEPYIRVPGAMKVVDIVEYLRMMSPWVINDSKENANSNATNDPLPAPNSLSSNLKVEIAYKLGKRREVWTSLEYELITMSPDYMEDIERLDVFASLGESYL